MYDIHLQYLHFFIQNNISEKLIFEKSKNVQTILRQFIINSVNSFIPPFSSLPTYAKKTTRTQTEALKKYVTVFTYLSFRIIVVAANFFEL